MSRLYTWNSKQPHFNGCLVKQPFFYVRFGIIQPTETTNKKIVVSNAKYFCNRKQLPKAAEH